MFIFVATNMVSRRINQEMILYVGCVTLYTMPDIRCPVVGCDYSTGDVDSVVVAALLNARTVGAHTSSQPEKQRQFTKVERPQLSDDIDEKSWNAFKEDWRMFIRANKVAAVNQPIKLFSCCASTLNAKLTSCCQDVFEKHVQDSLILLQSLAVIPVAVRVKRNELLQMHQDSGKGGQYQSGSWK